MILYSIVAQFKTFANNHYLYQVNRELAETISCIVEKDRGLHALLLIAQSDALYFPLTPLAPRT